MKGGTGGPERRRVLGRGSLGGQATPPPGARFFTLKPNMEGGAHPPGGHGGFLGFVGVGFMFIYLTLKKKKPIGRPRGPGAWGFWAGPRGITQAPGPLMQRQDLISTIWLISAFEEFVYLGAKTTFLPMQAFQRIFTMMSERFCALFLGAVFTALGIAGFFPDVVSLPSPEVADAAPLPLDMGDTYLQGFGYLFGLFPVNLMHNLVHLSVGIFAFACFPQP